MEVTGTPRRVGFSAVTVSNVLIYSADKMLQDCQSFSTKFLVHATYNYKYQTNNSFILQQYPLLTNFPVFRAIIHHDNCITTEDLHSYGWICHPFRVYFAIKINVRPFQPFFVNSFAVNIVLFTIYEAVFFPILSRTNASERMAILNIFYHSTGPLKEIFPFSLSNMQMLLIKRVSITCYISPH